MSQRSTIQRVHMQYNNTNSAVTFFFLELITKEGFFVSFLCGVNVSPEDHMNTKLQEIKKIYYI